MASFFVPSNRKNDPKSKEREWIQMKKTTLRRLTAILLTLLLMTALFACASGSEQEPASEGQQTEPGTDEVDVAGSSDAPEDPEQPSGQDSRIALNVPADGTYLVSLSRDVLVDSDGREYVKATQILFAELDDATIEALKVGDTVTLPDDYAFVIELMQRSETDEGKEILFNEGLERCFYVPETNTWRFTWPSEVAYTYEGEQYVIPLAIDATITDEYTPVSMGENVYRVPYDETDGTIGLLDSIGDFFSYHYYLESENATITVQNGEVASIVINYHP